MKDEPPSSTRSSTETAAGGSGLEHRRGAPASTATPETPGPDADRPKGDYQLVIDIPPYSALTEAQKANSDEYPVYLGFRSLDDAFAVARFVGGAEDPGRDGLGNLVGGLVSRVAETLAGRQDFPGPARPQHRGSSRGPSGQVALHDDSFVDQRSGAIDREVFLRLAREGAFPSTKIGKRVLARWGDVKAALQARRRQVPQGPPEASALQEPDDGLDDIRVRVGLKIKGGA